MEDTIVRTETADEAKLQEFVGRMLGDLGAAYIVPLVRIGDELGLYKALAAHGPLSSGELARRTATAERYVREWLSAHAAAGYVQYDGASGHFSMTPEQMMVFADPDSPVCMLGAFEIAYASAIDTPKVAEAFRTGHGVGWHDHHQCLFTGVERFFRAGYEANLIQGWLPSLDGVVEKLERGARVADVGCGHGVTTALMAKAFPRSTVIGFDNHRGSIERASQRIGTGAGGNLSFEVSGASGFPGSGYDLVTMFDCLHDMGDPVGAAAHALRSLSPDGTLMLVEPFAHDRLEDNLNPVGRVYYAASTMICTPASLAQEVGLALGAQAGEARLTEILTRAGFGSVRRAAETPFNIVLEAKP
ncbi:SAM-dependent methyltransferase PhcB [Skermanella stibiiresistens SB22]|uniref:SAM-dependent methyltransferase PhcB n=1 Tax=Skermanella stibiiresistens SB22 TaxID=1385369 RepID=W9HAA1_9PROT|nr:class I SAM-dependent methyltransferase [Skermanella stibiiresistens]EWY41661.1 SAM-dependent methyltransferase PhcB [Skermanella stibiiresistens SB22]